MPPGFNFLKSPQWAVHKNRKQTVATRQCIYVPRNINNNQSANEVVKITLKQYHTTQSLCALIQQIQKSNVCYLKITSGFPVQLSEVTFMQSEID